MKQSILKLTFSFLVIILCWESASSQMLFTESFTLILDTTKHIKGSFLPGFKYQNLRRDLIEIENQADISVSLKRNGLTFANKIAISSFGGETILSGGYVYGEYRRIYEVPLTLEYFGQIHWSEPRGMERKYAIGVKARWRILRKQNIGFFAGTGPFYEYERWNFNGVSDAVLIPANESSREYETVKLGSYISLKYRPFDNIYMDISLYHQARFEDLFENPRLASSSRITYNFSEHLGLALTYQNIYDPVPLVPIDRLFNRVDLGVSITF